MKDIFGRFTPEDPASYSLDEMVKILSQYTHKYVISYETDAKRPHYHFALFGMEISVETFRYQLKLKLAGQVYLSGTEIINKIQTIAYTIKDGNYKSNNLDINEFLMALVVAKPKVKFDSLIKELEEKYQSGNMTDRELISHILDIYIQTNRKIYPQHIKSQALLIKLRKETNKDKKQLLIERILDEL